MLLNRLPTLAAVCAITIFSGGCTRNIFDLWNKQAANTRIVCPVIKEYSAAEQDAALAEYDRLKAAGTFPVLSTFIDDYGLLRRQIRTCNHVGKSQAKVASDGK